MESIAILFEGEDDLGPIYDSDVGWTDATVWYTDMKDSHRFRVRKGPTQKTMLEMRGTDYGSVLSAILLRWSEIDKSIQSEQT